MVANVPSYHLWASQSVVRARQQVRTGKKEGEREASLLAYLLDISGEMRLAFDLFQVPFTHSNTKLIIKARAYSCFFSSLFLLV